MALGLGKRLGLLLAGTLLAGTVTLPLMEKPFKMELERLLAQFG